MSGLIAAIAASIATLFAVALGLQREDTPKLPDPPPPEGPSSGGGGESMEAYPKVTGYAKVEANARKYAQLRGWPKSAQDWLGTFAKVQAFSESRSNSHATNDSDSEAAASERARERTLEKGKLDIVFENYPDAADWNWGSGGWFGFLPAYGLSAFNDVADQVEGEPLSPYDVYDPWRSTVMLADFMRRVVRNRFGGIDASERNAYALKRGFAAGSLVAKPDAPRSLVSATNLEKALDHLGIPHAWALTPVPDEIWQNANQARVLNLGEQ